MQANFIRRNTDGNSRPKAHCRMVQGAVRQVNAEHTAIYAAKKERGYQVINIAPHCFSKRRRLVKILQTVLLFL